MEIKIKKLHPDAKMPSYATDGAGCFDLYSVTHCETEITNGRPVVVGTGLAFEIPEGHVMLIFSRSGHGFKHSTRLANCVGVIDSDYRGEVQVKLTRDSAAEGPLRVTVGDRIAQAMIVPVEQAFFEWVDELSSTSRGSGGFGSTGG